jgi:hypothetical protein
MWILPLSLQGFMKNQTCKKIAFSCPSEYYPDLQLYDGIDGLSGVIKKLKQKE